MQNQNEEYQGKIYIISGIPGSGKTTLAHLIAGESNTVEADKFPGLYSADGSFNGGTILDGKPLIVHAHQWCQSECKRLLEQKADVICVSNTSLQRWEAQPYYLLANQFNYSIQRVSLFNGGRTREELSKRNVHNVPLGVINDMTLRYQHGDDWDNGSKENLFLK